MNVILESTLTCPHCGATARETMPTDACLYFHECGSCGTRFKPKAGDCCVFCSYGSVPCPPVQEGGKTVCCAPPEAAAPWAFCSLDREAFGARMAEIDGVMSRFEGRARCTVEGMELAFVPNADLRQALEGLIDKERQCCGTLTLGVEEEADRVWLRVVAPEADRAVIHRWADRLPQVS